MKRTIKVRVEVADATEYAKVVAEIVKHPSVLESTWTNSQEIKGLLETHHGMSTSWAHGSIDEIVED